jgi:hypothetical protein
VPSIDADIIRQKHFGNPTSCLFLLPQVETSHETVKFSRCFHLKGSTLKMIDRRRICFTNRPFLNYQPISSSCLFAWYILSCVVTVISRPGSDVFKFYIVLTVLLVRNCFLCSGRLHNLMHLLSNGNFVC